MDTLLPKKLLQRGITLYLAIIVVTLILGIGLGISALLVSQLKTFRSIGDSLQSLYAADAGIEVMLAVQDCIDDYPGSGGVATNRITCIQRVIDQISGPFPPAQCAGNLDTIAKKGNCLAQSIERHEGSGSFDTRNRIGDITGPHYQICSVEGNCGGGTFVTGGTGLCPIANDYCAESTGDWRQTRRRVHFTGDFE